MCEREKYLSKRGLSIRRRLINNKYLSGEWREKLKGFRAIRAHLSFPREKLFKDFRARRFKCFAREDLKRLFGRED